MVILLIKAEFCVVSTLKYFIEKHKRDVFLTNHEDVI